MNKLVMLIFCTVLFSTVGKSQDTTIIKTPKLPKPPNPPTDEVRVKGIPDTKENKLVVFQRPALNRIIEHQLRQDGILTPSDKLFQFQLAEKKMVVNAKEMPEDVKNAYLTVYKNFMRMEGNQNLKVLYSID